MRFYNLKYIEKVADNIGSLTRRNNARGAESTNDVSPTIYSISDLYGFVNKFDNEFSPAPEVNPVLLNEDGTPKVFYHGTNSQFTSFSPEEMSSREGSYFFAENKEDAAAYGKYVMPVYLAGRNLADYDNQPSEFYKLRSKREQVQWLKDRGYDGWYADMDSGGWGKVSVFSESEKTSQGMHQGVLENESLADTTSDVFNSIHKTNANVNSNLKNPSTESDNKRFSRSKRDEKSAAAAEAEAKAGEIAKKWGISEKKTEALGRGLTNIFESVSGAEADMAFVSQQAESLAASAVRLWRILGV